MGTVHPNLVGEYFDAQQLESFGQTVLTPALHETGAAPLGQAS
jgi:hypothetical protein